MVTGGRATNPKRARDLHALRRTYEVTGVPYPEGTLMLAGLATCSAAPAALGA